MKREIAVNPMTVLRLEGEIVCREKLQVLDLNEIQYIIKAHSYDPFKTLTKKQNSDREYLINFLINRAANLCKLGQVFRTCKGGDLYKG